VDFVQSFAYQVPLKVTSRLFGLSAQDTESLKDWMRFEASGLSWMPPEFQEWQRKSAAEMGERLATLIEDRYVRPTEDATSDLILAQVARDGFFDPQEIRAQLGVLLMGGVITTAHLLSSALLLLLENPEQMAKVRSDGGLIPNMVEEALRLEAPSQWIPRRVAADTVLGGVEVPAGSFLAVMLASASRDEFTFDQPDVFDVERERAHSHLNFGYGRHLCLGAPLARLELRLSFECLLNGFDTIELTERNTFQHLASPAFRGLQHLYVVLSSKERG
jgi:cytochrome P450